MRTQGAGMKKYLAGIVTPHNIPGKQQVNDTARLLLILGSFNSALAVVLGAFGAHALKHRLDENMMQVYQTATQYHFYHALGLLVVGILALHLPASSLLRWSGLLLLAGIILFSGSLYALALSNLRWLGMITPLGGLAFILGWAIMLLALLKQ